MNNHDERISLRQVALLTGLSDSTLRRALRDLVDPLPCDRVGLGTDLKHSRILVRRSQLEQWIARRTAAATQSRDIVDEIVDRVRRDA